MTDSINHVADFSTGLGTGETARRVYELHGADFLHLLFADTTIEDNDNYRFGIEVAAYLYNVPQVAPLALRALTLPPFWEAKGRLVALKELRRDVRALLPRFHWLIEGRSPWQVFIDENFLGNSKRDPCSRILKRQLKDGWRKYQQYAGLLEPETTVFYCGISWDEAHRYEDTKGYYLPWRLEAPLCSPPYGNKKQWAASWRERGIEPPRLYELGFAHANCGGACVKAGQGHFHNLLLKLPEVYGWWEESERLIRKQIGKDVSILRDRSGKQERKLTLEDFRLRIQGGWIPDLFEIGGCACGL